jgi:hypothetical protein
MFKNIDFSELLGTGTDRLGGGFFMGAIIPPPAVLFVVDDVVVEVSSTTEVKIDDVKTAFPALNKASRRSNNNFADSDDDGRINESTVMNPS